MRTKWIWGAVIVLSVAGNLVLGAMLFGIQTQRHFHPFSIAMKNVKDMPPDERSFIHDTFKAQAPQLRASLRAARDARLDLANYIAGPDYNRAEAQKRFDDLRTKTAQSQVLAESIFLDVADKLPPQDRAKLLDAGK